MRKKLSNGGVCWLGRICEFGQRDNGPCGRPAPSGRSRGQAGLPAHKKLRKLTDAPSSEEPAE